MSTTLPRRDFLKISALTSGGLLLGFNWLGCNSSVSTPADADSFMSLNAYLKIGTDGSAVIYSSNPEIGQGVKTAMPMIVAEELDLPWEKVQVKQAGLDTQAFGRQLAGGSQSIRLTWDSLRKAGATARQMIRQAAANQWNVPVSEVITQDGIVSHESGKEGHYGEFAEAAQTLEVPEEVAFKNSIDYKLIGTPQPNVDNPQIVTGQPLFGLDFSREGMKYAMLVRPPAFRAKLIDFDASEALSVSGIEEVIEVAGKVAVIGNSTWAVMKARKLININWQMPRKPESTAYREQEMRRLLSGGKLNVKRKDGRGQAGFRGASKIVEASYVCPFLPHNTMEPMNFFAHVKEDSVELVGPTQTPSRARDTAAKLTGLPPENISVMMTRIGGGFGRRLMADYVEDAVQVSQAIKAPVKIIWTREDDMTAGEYRNMARYQYRAALDAEGNMTAFHVKGVAANSGESVRANNFPAGAVPDYLAETARMKSAITTGPWRSPIHNFLAVAEQSFLDEVAHAAGKDPLDFRLELLEKAKSEPAGELEYEPDRFMGVLKLVAEKSGWRNQQEGVFRGIACYYSHNSYAAEVAEIVMDGDTPRLQKIYCAIDCGIVINPGGAENQVQGGIIDGLGHALFGEITVENGKPEMQNFDTYRLIRNPEAPEVEVYFVASDERPTGLGEPSLPPAPAALANAIFAATGQRVRQTPFMPRFKENSLNVEIG